MFNRRQTYTAVLCSLTLWVGGVNALAQSPVKKPKTDFPKGSKFGFESRVVKGAPYSAVAVVETVQPLADGNRISSRTQTVVYRDGEGRTRREVESEGREREIFIVDPAAGASYTLLPHERVAYKSQPSFKLLTRINEETLQQMWKGAKVEPKRIQQPRDEPPRIKQPRVGSSGSASATTESSASVTTEKSENGTTERFESATEWLGRKTMEGVEAEGSRTTVTIPAGAVGNELPLKVVTESWYSQELHVLLMTRRSDPRDGETTYRLTRVSRGEPDPALFQVPADYTFLNKPPAPAKSAKPPVPAKPARRPNPAAPQKPAPQTP